MAERDPRPPLPLHRPRLVLALWGALCLAAVPGLLRLRVDFSAQSLLEAVPEEVARIQAWHAELPPRWFPLFVALEFEEPAGWDEVETAAAVARALEELPEVRSVVHAGNLPLPRPDAAWGRPGEEDRHLSFAAFLEAHPLLRGSLVSRDGRSLALALRTPRRLTEQDNRPVLETARRLAPPGCTVHLAGTHLVDAAMGEVLRRDGTRLLLRECLWGLLLLAWFLRSFVPGLLSVLACGSSVLILLGLRGWTGQDLGVLDGVVPALILGVGLADTVHLLHRLREEESRGQGRLEALGRMLRHAGPPCVLASLTTAFGFLGLLVSGHPAVRTLGLWAALGVGLALLAVLGPLPAMLRLLPAGRKRPALPPLRLRPPGARTGAAAALLLLLACVPGLLRLESDARWTEELPPEHRTVRELQWFQENFQGLLSIDLRLQGDLASPFARSALRRFEEEVEAHPEVLGVECWNDWEQELRGVLGTAAPEDPRRLLALVPPEFRPRHLVTEDFRQGRFLVRLGDTGTRRYLELEEEIRTRARALLEEAAPEPALAIRAEALGYNRLAHLSGRRVVRDLLDSLALTLAGVFLMIGLLFRSLRVALLSLVPNLLPLAAGLALAGWIGSPLRVATVLVFPLGLGLAVDDSIHLLHRFREERRRGGGVEEALERALRGTGRALVATTGILAGAGILGLDAAFRPVREAPLLLSAILLAALLLDLLLLPVLLRAFPGRKLLPPGSS